MPGQPVPPVVQLSTEVRLEDAASPPRVGLILLSTDMTTERDAARVLAPEGIAVHGTRVAFENPTTPENLMRMGPGLSAAVALLVPSTPLAAVCFACTSGTIEIGEETVAAVVHSIRPGTPVVTPPGAALAAFAALGVRRAALLTPYVPQTTEPMAAYFAAQGLELVSAACLGVTDDREMARIGRASIVEAARAADHPRAEALFVSCTALPALDAVEAMERAIGKPVVTSNQASLWQLLRHAGRSGPRPGFGRLFASAAEPALEALSP